MRPPPIRARRTGRRAGLWGLLALLLAAVPAAADSPRAVLVLVPGTPATVLLDRLAREPDLAREVGVGLLNADLPGDVDSHSAYLTLSAGRRLRFRRAEPALGELGRLVLASGRRVVYRALHPDGSVLPLPELGWRTVVPDSVPPIPAPVATDIGPLLHGTDLLVLDLSQAAADGWPEVLRRLLPLLRPGRDLVVVVSPDPGPTVRGKWRHLAPVLVWGAGWGGRPVTSATTRTAGLASLPDVAPTVLQHLQVPIPAAVSGRPLRPAPEGDLALVRARAAQALRNRDWMLPVLLGWGVLACAAGILAVTALATERPVLRRAARPGLAVALFGAVAILPSGVCTGASDAVPTALAMLPLGLLVPWTALRGQGPLPGLLAWLGAACVLDLLLGGRMLATNLMSDFANVGGRFYGIGNEFLGLLLGSLLLLPFVFRDGGRTLPDGRPARAAIGLAWLGTAVVVGHPGLGADLGGAASVAVAGLVSAVLFASTAPLRTRLLRLAGGLALCALLLGGAAALDLARPPTARSHVGEFAARALAGEWGPLLELARGKAALNLRMAATPYFLGSLAAAAPLLGWLARTAGGRVRELLAARPGAAVGIRSGLAGACVTALLNDTGVIGGALCAGVALIFLLDLLVSAASRPPGRQDEAADGGDSTGRDGLGG